MSIEDNLVLAASPDLSRFGLIDRSREQAATNEIVAKLHILANNLSAPVRTLSGGNQQKVVIGKWLATEIEVLLLSDPTKGVDIHARSEIYAIIGELAAAGSAALIFASEMQELLLHCDRILVMYEGRIVADLTGEAMTEPAIMAAAFGRPGQGVAAP